MPGNRFAVTAIERELEMFVIYFTFQTSIRIPLRRFTYASEMRLVSIKRMRHGFCNFICVRTVEPPYITAT